MAERRARQAHKWTPKQTKRLIRFRIEHEKDFLKSKFLAKKMWAQFVEDMELSGQVTGQQASKKWENLKQKYKDLRTPKTGSATDKGELTVATWQFYEDMHEALGRRPSIDPHVLVGSMEEVPTAVDMEDAGADSDAADARSSPFTSTTPDRTPRSTASSPERKRRRTNAMLEFLMQESEREQRRHEESEAKTERFLTLFEQLVEKM